MFGVNPEITVGYIHISIVKSPVPYPNAALLGAVKKSPLPSKYPLPPFVEADQAAVGLNGEKACTDTSPLRVMAKALVLLSMKRLLWQVSNEVLVMAVSGVVLGVKLEV